MSKHTHVHTRARARVCVCLCVLSLPVCALHRIPVCGIIWGQGTSRSVDDRCRVSDFGKDF